MSKGKKFFPGSYEELNDLVTKINDCFGDEQRILLEKLKRRYTILKRRSYDVDYYERFYKETSEKRRKEINQGFKEIWDDCNITPR